MKLLPDRFMKEAVALAIQAKSLNEVPVGAVVVHQGEVIASAHNLREQNQDPLGHAELLVLRAAAKKLNSWRLTGCTLVVTLEPCPMCLAACAEVRIDSVVYGAKDPAGGGLSRLKHSLETEYFPSVEAAKLLKDFFSEKRQ